MSKRPRSKVLLIHEDAVALHLWKQYLLSETEAIDVHSTDSVMLEEVQSIHPDLIVLGRTSTACDSHYSEGLRSYLTVHPTKVLVIMAWRHLEDLELAVQFGADDVLATPFSRKEFIYRISALLPRRE